MTLTTTTKSTNTKTLFPSSSDLWTSWPSANEKQPNNVSSNENSHKLEMRSGGPSCRVSKAHPRNKDEPIKFFANGGSIRTSNAHSKDILAKLGGKITTGSFEATIPLLSVLGSIYSALLLGVTVNNVHNTNKQIRALNELSESVGSSDKELISTIVKQVQTSHLESVGTGTAAIGSALATAGHALEPTAQATAASILGASSGVTGVGSIIYGAALLKSDLEKLNFADEVLEAFEHETPQESQQKDFRTSALEEKYHDDCIEFFKKYKHLLKRSTLNSSMLTLASIAFTATSLTGVGVVAPVVVIGVTGFLALMKFNPEKSEFQFKPVVAKWCNIHDPTSDLLRAEHNSSLEKIEENTKKTKKALKKDFGRFQKSISWLTTKAGKNPAFKSLPNWADTVMIDRNMYGRKQSMRSDKAERICEYAVIQCEQLCELTVLTARMVEDKKSVFETLKVALKNTGTENSDTRDTPSGVQVPKTGEVKEAIATLNSFIQREEALIEKMEHVYSIADAYLQKTYVATPAYDITLQDLAKVQEAAIHLYSEKFTIEKTSEVDDPDADPINHANHLGEPEIHYFPSSKFSKSNSFRLFNVPPGIDHGIETQLMPSWDETETSLNPSAIPPQETQAEQLEPESKYNIRKLNRKFITTQNRVGNAATAMRKGQYHITGHSSIKNKPKAQ